MTQRSKASFLSTFDSLFADNTVRAISEADMRTFNEDIKDSSMFITDNFIDEDSMASDSATKAPSQQSVKAYVDSRPHNPCTMYTKAGGYISAAVVPYSVTTLALSSDTLRAYPIVIAKTVTITNIVSNVSGNVALSKYRIGIYTDNGDNYPDALVSGSDAAEYDSSTTGEKTSGAVSITLTPGLYWLAVLSNSNPTLRAITSAAVYQLIPHDGSDAASDGFSRYLGTTSYGAMPATYTAGQSGGAGNHVRILLTV